MEVALEPLVHLEHFWTNTSKLDLLYSVHHSPLQNSGENMKETKMQLEYPSHRGGLFIVSHPTVVPGWRLPAKELYQKMAVFTQRAAGESFRKFQEEVKEFKTKTLVHFTHLKILLCISQSLLHSSSRHFFHTGSGAATISRNRAGKAEKHEEKPYFFLPFPWVCGGGGFARRHSK